MDVRKALRERDRLRAEAQAAIDARDRHRAEVRRLEELLRALPARRTAALRAQARTGEAADLEALDAEEATLRRDRGHAEQAADAASEAARDAQAEIVRLHRDRLEEFMVAAEALTGEAHRALAALKPSYLEAVRAWQAARREWNTLAADIEDLPITPPCPLPDPASVFAIAARPPGVTPADPGEHEPAAPVSDSPPAGSVLEFEHVERPGVVQSAVAGTALAEALSSSEGWRRTGTRAPTQEATA